MPRRIAAAIRLPATIAVQRIKLGGAWSDHKVRTGTGQGVGHAPDASFGTHFFQDLVEAQIFPLAIYLDDADAVFRRDFFYGSPNHLLGFSPQDKGLSSSLRLIEVESYRPGHCLEIVMDDEAGQAVALLVPKDRPS